MPETAEHKRNVARVVAAAWLDPHYLARLKKDPAGVLKEAGVKVGTKRVHVVEDTDDTTHFVIPKAPAHFVAEHRKAHHAHPDLCSSQPGFCADFCSAIPELCSTPQGEKSPTPQPDICSIR